MPPLTHRHLLLFVTHTCALKHLHPWCDQRLQSGHTRRNMTLHDARRIVSICSAEQWEAVDLIGGEPLEHPAINQIVGLLRTDIQSSSLALSTSAVGQERLSDASLDALSHVYISLYPGLNNSVVEQLSERAARHGVNVEIVPVSEFGKCNALPQDFAITDEQVHETAQRCQRRFPSFYPGRIYPCCIGEAIDRTNPNLRPSHIALEPDWFDRISRIQSFPICQRCWHICELRGCPTDVERQLAF